MDIKKLAKEMVRRGASDIYMIPMAPATLRINNTLKTSKEYEKPLSPEQTEKLAFSLLGERLKNAFIEAREMTIAISLEGICRFRANVFYQRNSISLVLRNVNLQLRSFEELNLPPVLGKISMAEHGLVLVVGGAGSGKSATLAAMIDYRNSNSEGHIITLEDPIEFLHSHKRSLVTQREVGMDTKSYLRGLENALREAPDVVVIGEIDDMETIERALNIAKAGHLCLSTLHAVDTIQAIERLLGFFPMETHKRLYEIFSQTLTAVIAQRLYTGTEGKLVPSVEVLVGTPKVNGYLRVGDMSQLKKSIEMGGPDGMQTFEQSLSKLISEERVSLRDALGYK